MAERVTFTDVLRVREFRYLWIAEAQSGAGDQLARVAISVLVFEKTASAGLTALTYALTFLPGLLGGALLSGLADRHPRRRVMIVCDCIRAALLAVMALPGLSLWVLCGLLVLAVLVGSPFSAAESALVADILEGERYAVATGLRTITGQSAQLVGFACGGIAVAAIGARAGLAVDAATFVLSVLLLTVGVAPRPAAAPAREDAGPDGYARVMLEGFRYVAGNPQLRVLLGLSWLAGLYVIPEGLAPPYAKDLEAGARAVGLLMAAAPAGTAVGTYVFVRMLSPEARTRWMGPLAAATGVPLAACVLHPSLPVSLMLWAAGGAGMAYQVEVIASYVRIVPMAVRGRAVGVASSGLTAVQGLGILVGGAVAGVWGSRSAVGLAGTAGAVLAIYLAARWAHLARNTAKTASPSAKL
jgi:MFS family permease